MSLLATPVIVSISLLVLSIAVYRRRRRNDAFLDPEGRAILITGCDSGFGNQLARKLLDMGFTVFATCLFPDGEGAQSLVNYSSPGKVMVIRLDVTSDEEVAQVKQYVLKSLPAKGLWGIVNNAGVSNWGLLGWHTIEDYRRTLDINLLGCIRTSLAFAPLIRKSQGRMVFMSSTNSYMSVMNGIYAMTKAGMERFCDSLRLEMRSYGVKVCLIQPGNFSPATNIQPRKSADEIWNSLSAEAKESSSREQVENINRLVNTALSKGSSNSYEVVDAMVDALTSATPKPRCMVATFAEKIVVYLSIWLPTSVFDKIITRAMA